VGTDCFGALNLWRLTDWQFLECLKQRVDQGFRILAPCAKPDAACAGLALSIVPLALD
jgi:hypothetical protein